MGKHEFLSCGAFFEKRIEIHLSHKIRTTKKKKKKKKRIFRVFGSMFQDFFFFFNY